MSAMRQKRPLPLEDGPEAEEGQQSGSGAAAPPPRKRPATEDRSSSSASSSSRGSSGSSTSAHVPSARRYEHSYQHMGPVRLVLSADGLSSASGGGSGGSGSGYIVSLSADGVVKFWRKVAPECYAENGKRQVEMQMALDEANSGSSGQAGDSGGAGRDEGDEGSDRESGTSSGRGDSGGTQQRQAIRLPPISADKQRTVEFAKTFVAHKPIPLARVPLVFGAISQRADGGTTAVSVAGDARACIFDVPNFDMTNVMTLDRIPLCNPVVIPGRRWFALAGTPVSTITSILSRLPGGGAGPSPSTVLDTVSADPGDAAEQISPCDVAIFNIAGDSSQAVAREAEVVHPDNSDTDETLEDEDASRGTASESATMNRPFRVLKLHSSPVLLLCHNPVFDVCVSADASGKMACFAFDDVKDSNSDSLFPSALFERHNPSSDSNADGRRLSELDFAGLFYYFVKNKTICIAMSFSPDGTKLATLGLDRKVRIFDFLKGKLLKIFDETLEVYQRQQIEWSSSDDEATRRKALDPMEFGRRMSSEKELDSLWSSWASGLRARFDRKPFVGSTESNERFPMQPPTLSISFDGSGGFLAFGTMRGIKVVDVNKNRIFGILGRDDNIRFTSFAFFQSMLYAAQSGIGGSIEDYTNNQIDSKELMRLKMGGGNLVQTTAAGGIQPVKVHDDPTLICAALKKSRFYLITSREPFTGVRLENGCALSKVLCLSTLETRDVFNEAPSAADVSLDQTKKKSSLARLAVIHTTMGDVRVNLFWEQTPKTVENFTKLAQRGYYNNLLFHRVIVNFMVQTGDPTGTGRGGESAFPGGKSFDDEIRLPELKHERYTLSMANAGPNTNGSQFFITSVPCPSLDGRHTVFGRVTAGQDVIHAIEKLPTDKDDRPIHPVRMLSVSVTLVGHKER